MALHRCIRLMSAGLAGVGVALAAPSAHAAGAGGSWTIREGVRLSHVSFSAATKDGRLRPDLLVVGRATGRPRTLVLSVAVCRSGSPTCRTEASRRLRFIARPRTIVGWRPTLRDARAITRLRFRLSRAGAPARASAATMVLSLPATAWVVTGFNPGLFVRESASAVVDAVTFRADPVAGGGATVTARARVRTVNAFDLAAGIGACGSFVGCPLQGVRRTFRMNTGGTNELSTTVTLPAPPAGTSRVRFRADGGVRPSPFLSFLLPWPR